MVFCPVCRTENHHLAITCRQCRGFIQPRIENLDLFSTLWGLIEQPSKTFHTIAVANHKNYTVVLPAIQGIGLSFTLFWFLKVGESVDMFAAILMAGIILALPLGIVCALLISGTVTSICILRGLSVEFRNVHAVVAYGLMPWLIISIIVVPIEILTFGIYFFRANPSPMILKPLSYIVLLGLHAGSGIWSMILLVFGVGAVLGAGWKQASWIVVVAISIVAGLIAGVARLLLGQV